MSFEGDTLKPINTPPGGFEFFFTNKSKKQVNAVLRIFRIHDNGSVMLYVPSLEAPGYGKNEKTARDMLREVLEDLFHSFFSMKLDEVESELTNYGWAQQKYFNKRFENRSYIDRDGILKNFELPKDTLIEEQMVEFA